MVWEMWQPYVHICLLCIFNLTSRGCFGISMLEFKSRRMEIGDIFFPSRVLTEFQASTSVAILFKSVWGVWVSSFPTKAFQRLKEKYPRDDESI